MCNRLILVFLCLLLCIANSGACFARLKNYDERFTESERVLEKSEQPIMPSREYTERKAPKTLSEALRTHYLAAFTGIEKGKPNSKSIDSVGEFTPQRFIGDLQLPSPVFDAATDTYYSLETQSVRGGHLGEWRLSYYFIRSQCIGAHNQDKVTCLSKMLTKYPGDHATASKLWDCLSNICFDGHNKLVMANYLPTSHPVLNVFDLKTQNWSILDKPILSKAPYKFDFSDVHLAYLGDKIFAVGDSSVTHTYQLVSYSKDGNPLGVKEIMTNTGPLREEPTDDMGGATPLQLIALGGKYLVLQKGPAWFSGTGGVRRAVPVDTHKPTTLKSEIIRMRSYVIDANSAHVLAKNEIVMPYVRIVRVDEK